MSYRPPQDQDESHGGGVPYEAQQVQGGVPSWMTSSGQPQVSDSYGTVPDWGSPPSSQYNIPSTRSPQVQQHASTQSQLYPFVQGPTYSGGAPSDRESLALRQQYLQQVDQSQYNTATAAQTQYRGFLYQDRQQDYPQRTPQQQQYPPQYSQQQRYPPSRNTMVHGISYGEATSFGENPPGGYHERSAHTDPTCRFLNCRRPVRRDLSTNELTEYCGEEHMRQDVRRGVPLCPSCKKSPRRLDSKFCGSACAEWAKQIQQQPAGSGHSFSRRVEEVRSHTIITETGTYGGANNYAVGGSYQSGGYPKAESLASEPVTSPGSVVGGGGGSGGGSSVNVNIY